MIQQPHEEKAQSGVHPQVHPVKKPLPDGVPGEQEGLGQGTAFGSAEGEQAAPVQSCRYMPSLPQGQPGDSVQAIPQHAHQPVGGARILRVLLVVIQHNAGYGYVGAQLFLPGLGTVGGFRGARTNPVEINRITDGQGGWTFQGQLKHELPVLSVGQFRMPEIDPMGGKEASADETAPDHGAGAGDVVRQISLTPQSHLLGGEHLLELKAAYDQLIVVRCLQNAPELPKNIGLNHIVRVHEPDIISPGGGQPRVPGGGDAAVSLGDNCEIRVLFGERLQNESAFVRGAVVHTDDLIVRLGKILGKQRVQALFQIQLRVVNRNHNTQKQGLHLLSIKR